MISQNVWAPPFFFGPWVELENHTGDIAYTVYFTRSIYCFYLVCP